MLGGVRIILGGLLLLLGDTTGMQKKENQGELPRTDIHLLEILL